MDGAWTTAEARERAAFVLGVTPWASTTEARFGYRAQLAIHAGDSEHERTARRTLMAAWAVWNRTDPEREPDEVVDALAIAQDARARGLVDDPDAASRTDAELAHDVEELLATVEVVEMVREPTAEQRLWHPVAGEGRVVVTDGRSAYLEAMQVTDPPPGPGVAL